MKLLLQMSSVLLGTAVYMWWKWPDMQELNFGVGVMLGVLLTVVAAWPEKTKHERIK
jgi:hypothetical protein